MYARSAGVPLACGHAAGCLLTRSARSGQYCVRPPGPQDVPGIRDFVGQLSADSQYFRFLTTAVPNTALVRSLAGAGSGTADVLIVIDGHGAVIGHGMAAEISHAGNPAVDLALVITDRWQGQGAGRSLFGLLAHRAMRRGSTTLGFDVAPGNARVLGIVAQHWPDAVAQRTGDAMRFLVEIGPGFAPGP